MSSTIDSALPSGFTPRRRSLRARVVRTYLLLAAFDLFAVSTGLFLHHRVMTIHANSIEVDKQWARRVERYAHFDDLAQATDAPGNDVFLSHAVEQEAQKVDAAFSRYKAYSADQRREIDGQLSAEIASPLKGDFGQIDRAMDEMVDMSHLIFAHLRMSQNSLAGEKMAEMDRRYAQVGSAIRALKARVRELQDENFERETAAAVNAVKFEYLIGGLLLLMVCGATLYGCQISRQMAGVEREQDVQMAALQGEIEQRQHAESALKVAHDQSEVKVQQRTAELARINGSLQQEIAERRHVQATLDKLSSAVEQAADSIFITDFEGRIEYVNPAFEETTGWKSEEMVGRTPAFLKSGKHPATFYERMWESILAGKVFRAEFTNCKKSGEIYSEEKTITPIRNREGKITHFVSTGRDVTERKRAEVENHLQRIRFQQLFDSAPIGLVLIDPDDRVLQVNKGFETIFGYSVDEVLGQHINQIVVPAEFAFEAEDLTKRSLRGEIFVREVTRRRKDGTLIPVQVSGVRIAAEEETIGVYGMYLDLTERKRLEEQFLQSQKMEAIGRLAGGVAHDFNNLLTAVTGYAELVKMNLGEQSPLRDDVEQIRKAGERAASLTRQLLAFSRKQILQPKVIDLNAVIADLDKMLERLIGEDINLVRKYSPGLKRVKADPGQIGQVIVNLVVNSRDAMARGGTLTIETANICVDENFSRENIGVNPGCYAMLSVSDTGCGMGEETLSHIFEPFFTTKEKHKGTGLGLSTVYGIITQSGGSVSVKSKPGKGTRFRIFLPPAEAGEDDFYSVPNESEMLDGSETILLVEDEPTVRKLASTILSKFGYSVVVAGSGEESLELCRRESLRPDLLISDVVMPQMSGRELAERLQEFCPGIRVLYMSGYPDDAMVRHGISDSSVAFLQKPFTPRSLARKVREVMGGASVN